MPWLPPKCLTSFIFLIKIFYASETENDAFCLGQAQTLPPPPYRTQVVKLESVFKLVELL